MTVDALNRESSGLPERRTSLASGWLGAWILAAIHLPLAVVMFDHEWLAKGHFLATALIGLGLTARFRSAAVPTLAALYIASAEVLWRMTRGYFFWEQAKYLLILFLALAFLRSRSRGTLTERLSLLLPLFLLPSCVLTIEYLGFTFEARRAIAFNLAGPIALGMACVVFSRLSVREVDPRHLMMAGLLPLVGTAGISVYSLLTAEDLFFGLESTTVVTGSYGPNQVSAVLGLAALYAVVFGLATGSRISRGLAIALAVGFLSQAALTFSRGGVVAAVFALAVLLVHLIARDRTRTSLLMATALVALLSVFWLLPRLNELTGGNLAQRYSTWEMTGREEIMQGDLELFLRHPWLGVGPGMSPWLRTERQGQAAHTEFTRLLAEHGLFGGAAILIVAAIPWLAYRRAPTRAAQGWVACFVTWALLAMAHSATRIAPISVVFALGLVLWPPRGRRRESSSDRPPVDASPSTAA